MLETNIQAPDFSLPDQTGVLHKLSDYLGCFVLLYFYPKDDTPGCTKEACIIRDHYPDFEANNIKVLGISADSETSHKKFSDKYKLPFTLLSDPKKEIIKKYEAIGTIGTKRISYLIDPQGVIIKTYSKVDPAIHGPQIIKDVSLFN